MMMQQFEEFERLLDSKTEWICGHTAGAVCAECYRALARRAANLADEVFELNERIDVLRSMLRRPHLWRGRTVPDD